MSFRKFWLLCLVATLAPSAFAGCSKDFNDSSNQLNLLDPFALIKLAQNPEVTAISSDGAVITYVSLGGNFGTAKVYRNGQQKCQANLQVAVGDFNGDGVLDSASVVPSGLRVVLHNADGTQLSASSYRASVLNPSIVAADLDGDDEPDLAVTQNDNYFSGPGGSLNRPDRLRPRNPKPLRRTWCSEWNFQRTRALPIGPNAADLAMADVNLDGKADLLMGECCVQAEASFLLGNGDGTFQPELKFPLGGDPGRLAIADFSGDGKPDAAILSLGYSTHFGTLTIKFNAFAAATPQLTP